jgi:hypothetical protein
LEAAKTSCITTYRLLLIAAFEPAEETLDGKMPRWKSAKTIIATVEIMHAIRAYDQYCSVRRPFCHENISGLH